MAGGAVDVLVGAFEGEFRFAVVECPHPTPAILAVTAVALLTEPLLVRFLRLVTVVAASGGAAKRDRRSVAAVAAHRFVATFELEVRNRVIESLAIELDDVGAPPLVVSVTVPALLVQCVGVAAVKAPSVAAIGGCILVTRNAQTGLRLPGKRLVAVLALLLKLGMPGNQGPGHDQRFEDVLRPGAPAHRNGNDRSDRNRLC